MKQYLAVFIGKEATMIKWNQPSEAAAKMFLNHPHFALFPGDSVEVIESLPIPGRD